ncbi:MAG TPA: hypothetical protein VI382_00740 [Candidatus Manganitrophaceae bacterium]|nr:hypothetical protein [Candidatus Manganitrophaceae bacterium]
MTPQEKESFEKFVFRHANKTLIDYALGHDIFDKVVQQRINRLEKNYFLTLAEDEERELLEAQKSAPSPATQAKIDRLLKNVREAKEILKR